MKGWRGLAFSAAISLLLTTAACNNDGRATKCVSLPGGGGFCLQPTTAITPFEVQQKVEIQFRGKSETIIVELEINSAGMRLAGLTPFGQTLLRVSYDNLTTTATEMPNARFPPELLISLLQIALWPADLLRIGLEKPLILEEGAGQRRILNRDEVTLRVNYTGDHLPFERIQIDIPRGEITINIETIPGDGVDYKGKKQ